MGYIYKITNTINKKAYIGVTVQTNPNERWSHHKSSFRQGNGCPLLQKAVKKYGEDAFTFEVLIICFDKDTFKFEPEYIKKYNTIMPNGYNILEGGKMKMSFLGKKHSDDTKKIISQKSKEYNSRPEAKEKARQTMNNFHKTHNIGDILRKSEKWKKAVEEGRIGKGHIITEECKQKISNALKKRHKEMSNKPSDSTQINKKKETIKKISETSRKVNGRKVSQYTKDGVFISSFESIVEAGEKNGIHRKNIQACLTGPNKTAGGFIWKYNELKEPVMLAQQNQLGST